MKTKLWELRQKHEAAGKELIGLAEAGGEAYETKAAEVRGLVEQIKRLESAQDLAAATAQPVAGQGDDGVAAPYVKSAVEPAEKGHTFARIVRAVANAKGDIEKAADWAKKAGDSFTYKAINASDPTSGGVMIAPQYADEFIDLLRPREAITPLVTDVRPLTSGTLAFRRGTSDAIATYAGESQQVASSQPSSGQMDLVARDLYVLVPITNQYLQYAGAGADRWILNSALKAAALRKDLAFYRGDGTGNTPRGLVSFATEAGNVISSAGTKTLADVDTEVNAMLTKLAGANVPMIAPAWVMHPRTKIFLSTLRNAQGMKVYPEIDEKNTFRGFPISTTTQVPINLGGTGSELTLCDFDSVVVGEATGVAVTTSQEATYWDGSAWVSAFQNNQTLVKVHMAHDFNMKHIEAACTLSGIQWF